MGGEKPLFFVGEWPLFILVFINLKMDVTFVFISLFWQGEKAVTEAGTRTE